MERGIAENLVKRLGRKKVANVIVENLNTVGKGTGKDILSGLFDRRLVYLHTNDFGLQSTLGSHQRDKTRT